MTLYFLMQVIHWMIYATLGAFASAYLLSKGYTNTTIGMITALMSTFSFFLQPLIANWIDNARKEKLSLSLYLLSVSALSIFALLYFFSDILFISVFYIILGTIFFSIQPLMNSIVAKAEQNDIYLNFGVARAGGSIGYAISCSLLGNLIVRFGTDILMFTGMIMLIFFIAVTMLLFKKLKLDRKEIIVKEKLSYRDFLKNNPLFLLVIAATALVFVSNSVLSNYMLQIVRAIGGDSSDMGNMLALSAMLEVIPMVMASKITKYIPKQKVLTISAWVFVLKAFLTLLAPSVKVLYLAQIVQLMGFSIFMPVMVSFIPDVLKTNEAVRGQALYTMAVQLSGVFSSFYGGMMLDHFKVSTLLIVTIFISSLGAAILTINISRLKRS